MQDATRIRAERAFFGHTDNGFRVIAAGEVADVNKETAYNAISANRAKAVDPKTALYVPPAPKATDK